MSEQFTDDELNALLDGSTDERLRQRAEAASDDQLAAARQLEAELRRNLYRWDCPSPQQLGNYFLNRLSTPDADAVARHLTVCPHCQAELKTLQTFMELEVRPEAQPPVSSIPARVKRTLLRPTPQPNVVVRGGSDLFNQTVSGVDFTLFLEAQRHNVGVTLNGQVVALDPQEQSMWIGALIEVVQDQQLQATGVLDEMGEFLLTGLQSGAAEIRITNPTKRTIHVLTDPLLPEE